MTSLRIDFSWDDGAKLFYAQLENGTRFAVEINNLGGKLAANLALFRDAVKAEKGERPLRPTQWKSGLSPEDLALIAEAEKAGKVTKVASSAEVRALSLEDLDL